MATIFEDDFNSYDDGDLNGQGDWSANAIWDVQGTIVKEGAKAVKATNGNWYEMSKDGTARTDGRITFYVRAAQTDAHLNCLLRQVGAADFAMSLYFNGDGNIQYKDDVGYHTIQAYSADQWYEVEVEWRSSDHKLRYRIDEGDWTDWKATWLNWTTGFDRVWITQYGTGTFYVDYIAENPYAPPAAGRSYGYIFTKIYEHTKNLAQRIFLPNPLLNPNRSPPIPNPT